ncbi:hypothetical protein ACFX1Q_034708 [Malus domestica]
MTNISMSPFTNEIKWIDPPCGFTMPHFIPYKGDEDPNRHLKYYRSTMILYRNNDALMCKIFATTLQVPIGQILCKLKNEPCFELPPPMKDDLTRLDHTKYCAFYQGPGHTTNGCLKWKQYLEKLTNEGRCNEYLDRSTKRPTQAGEVPITP